MRTRLATLTAILACRPGPLTACAGSFDSAAWSGPPPRTHRRRARSDHAGSEVVLPAITSASPPASPHRIHLPGASAAGYLSGHERRPREGHEAQTIAEMALR